jgi:hypothetical protein
MQTIPHPTTTDDACPAVDALLAAVIDMALAAGVEPMDISRRLTAAADFVWELRYQIIDQDTIRLVSHTETRP